MAKTVLILTPAAAATAAAALECSSRPWPSRLRVLLAVAARGPAPVVAGDRQLAEWTGLARETAGRAAGDLLRLGVLVELAPPAGSRGRVVGVSADLERWRVPWARGQSPAAVRWFHVKHLAGQKTAVLAGVMDQASSSNSGRSHGSGQKQQQRPESWSRPEQGDGGPGPWVRPQRRPAPLGSSSTSTAGEPSHSLEGGEGGSELVSVDGSEVAAVAGAMKEQGRGRFVAGRARLLAAELVTAHGLEAVLAAVAAAPAHAGVWHALEYAAAKLLAGAQQLEPPPPAEPEPVTVDQLARELRNAELLAELHAGHGDHEREQLERARAERVRAQLAALEPAGEPQPAEPAAALEPEPADPPVERSESRERARRVRESVRGARGPVAGDLIGAGDHE